MNSDPNQAAREWWQRQENKDEPEEQGLQESQDSQATRQYPVNRNYQDPQDPQDSEATRQYPLERGRPADQGQQPGQRYQADQGYAGGQGFAAGAGSPATPTFTPNPGTADEAPPAQGARADSGFSAGQ